MMRCNLVLIVLLFFLVGCASGTQKLKKIDPDMSSQQVEEIMGQQDGYMTAEKDGHEYLLYKYLNRYCDINVSLYDKCDYYVIFEDNRVIETKEQSIRSREPHMRFYHLFDNHKIKPSFMR